MDVEIIMIYSKKYDPTFECIITSCSIEKIRIQVLVQYLLQ